MALVWRSTTSRRWPPVPGSLVIPDQRNDRGAKNLRATDSCCNQQNFFNLIIGDFNTKVVVRECDISRLGPYGYGCRNAREQISRGRYRDASCRGSPAVSWCVSGLLMSAEALMTDTAMSYSGDKVKVNVVKDATRQDGLTERAWQRLDTAGRR